MYRVIVHFNVQQKAQGAPRQFFWVGQIPLYLLPPSLSFTFPSRPLPYPPLPLLPLKSRPLDTTSGSGGACKLPSGVWGIRSGKRIWCTLILKSDIWWHQLLVIILRINDEHTNQLLVRTKCIVARPTKILGGAMAHAAAPSRQKELETSRPERRVLYAPACKVLFPP